MDVTDEKGEAIKLENRRSLSMTNLIPVPQSTCSPPSPVLSSSYCAKSSADDQGGFPHPESLTNDEGGLRVDKPQKRPLASSSPFKLKTSSSVADNAASSSSVSSLDSTMALSNSKHLVMGGGDDSMDFMKLSLREGSSVVSPYPSSSSTTCSNALLSSLNEEPASVSSVKMATRDFRSLLIFIPLRLGQDKFNEMYTESLKVCVGGWGGGCLCAKKGAREYVCLHVFLCVCKSVLCVCDIVCMYILCVCVYIHVWCV